MIEQVTYKGRKYMHSIDGIYVNNYGVGCVCWENKPYNMGHRLKFLPYHADRKTGRRYITYAGNKYWLDFLIAITFLVKPDIRFAYVPEYIDGNKSHCTVTNLRWVPSPQIMDSKTGLNKVCVDEARDIWVHENGDIYERGKKQYYKIEGVDADTDLAYVLDNPCVRLGRSHDFWEIDTLMSKAGFVQGDIHLLDTPRIIHVDGDRLNYSSSNLLYVDASDPRYTDYCRKRDFDVQAREDELNHGKRYPGKDRTAKWMTN